ncbi:UNVERIFIED_CONTAM: Hydroxyproline O-arabinosyltransferase RDN2 [Sesamum angustifolium]|uniref:Hydroxyproline O-arabinosyltransferase RDN2 n=1 Tax=Sesamum angustifolium TaxID=2727405 RepID=A0AAW2J8W5_9LAMI
MVVLLSMVVLYNFIMAISPSLEDKNQLLIDPVIGMPGRAKKQKNETSRFHVALTATETPYSKWQCRIMYYWYKKKKDLPGSEMGKFTRILHSGKPDNLMDEMPTFRVDPFHRYILMAEPDHIFLSPLPNLVYDRYPVAFPFSYIKPIKNEKIIRKFFPEEMGPVTNIDPIGNSPVIIKKVRLAGKNCAYLVERLVEHEHDPETDHTFGWVLEMYGYAVASALHGVQHILRKDFMLQPPWDLETANKFILHYTYGCDYNLKGELTYGKVGEWQFDKRTYLDGPPPRNLSLPPPGAPESVVTLINLINEATANLPNWDDVD